MNKNFSIPIKEINIQKMNESDFLRLEMYCISDGVNRNDSEFTLDSMVKSLDTFKNKPVLGYFNTTNSNFEEHNSDISADIKDGDYFYDYTKFGAEKPVGIISESDTIEIVNEDGKNWIKITASIWTKYNKQAVENLIKAKKKKVSVEVSVVEYHTNKEGVEVIDSFIFDGVTILGYKRGTKTLVEEGIAGAHLKLLEISRSDKFVEYKTAMCFALNNVKGGEKMKMNLHGLSVGELSNKIWNALDEFKYVENEYDYNKYWIDNIYDDYIIVHNNEDGKMYKIDYIVEDSLVVLNMESLIEVEETYTPVNVAEKREGFISKDKLGTEDALKIDKSKEAMSETAWGEVNKSQLKKKVLMAANYKTIVDDVFLLLEEGYLEGKEGSLKYPVMQIKSDTLVYNRYGLSSALAYAEKENETAVISKIKKIYKKLGLDNKEESDDAKKDMVKEEENKDMIKEFISKIEEKGYSYISKSENTLYLRKENKIYTIEFSEEADAEKKYEDMEFTEMCDIPGAINMEVEVEEEKKIIEIDMCSIYESIDELKCHTAEKDLEVETLTKKLEEAESEKADLTKKNEEMEEEIRMSKQSELVKLTDEEFESIGEEMEESVKNDIRKNVSENKYSNFDDVLTDIAKAVYVGSKKRAEFKYSANKIAQISDVEDDDITLLSKTVGLEKNK